MPNAQNVRREVQRARAQLAIALTIPQKLERLVTHCRNRRVFFRRRYSHKDKTTGKAVSHKSFLVDRNLCYDGITKAFGHVFWTSYAAPSVKDTRVQPRTCTGCYDGGTGKGHGTRVHEGLERLTKVIHTKLSKKDGTPTVAYVDPCAYRILKTLVNRSIIPIVSEFVIFDEYTGLATAIDCIAWDTSTNEIVAIEIKTGHTGQIDYTNVAGRAHFRPPMQHIPDSPANRAATQLLMSLLILARRYGIQIDRGIIVRPLSWKNDVQFIEMPSWTADPLIQQNMYAQLRSFVTSGANAKRVIKRTCNGTRHRSAMEQQEARQASREIGKDPSDTIYWTPTPRNTPNIVPPKSVARQKPPQHTEENLRNLILASKHARKESDSSTPTVSSRLTFLTSDHTSWLGG